MRIIALGSREFLLGLRLAGVKDVFETKDPEEAMERIRESFRNEQVGVIVIESTIFDVKRNELIKMKRERPLPIFARFPTGEVRLNDS